ncbi:nose resistant to fluoxetine protein 6-like isoform X2 [Haemaphysalis longicornis]
MGETPLLRFFPAYLPFVAILCWSSIVGTSMIGSNASASPAVENMEPSPKTLAASVRQWVGGLIRNMPPWVTQRFLEAPVSAECSLGLLKMIRGFSELEPWALRMADSTGKVPSGVFTGTTTELGSFDECLQTVVRDQRSAREVVRAQYCSLYLRFPNDSSIDELLLPAFLMTHPNMSTVLKYRHEPWLPGLRWGICVVSDCSQQELQMVAKALLGDAAQIEVKYCTTGLLAGLTTSQIAVTAVFAVLLFLLVAGTLVDLYATNHGKASVGVTALRSFSVPANLRLLTSVTTDKASDSYSLRFMHGIRAICIFYIVFGHSTMEYSFATSGTTFSQGYVDSYESTLAAAAFMTVDTFFFLSGYLLSFGLSGAKSSQGRVKTAVVASIRRWYRLMIPVAFVASGFSLLPLFVRGPTTDAAYDKFHRDVSGYWWASLLSVRNYFPELVLSVGVHLWYISADYQLFLAALIVHQLGFRKRVTVGILVALSVACSSFTAWQMWGTRYTPVIVQRTETATDYVNMISDVYVLPTYHAVCYFGGCITFFAVQKYRKENMSKFVKVAMWGAAMGCGAACVLYRFDWTRGVEHSDVANVLLALWDRTIWTIGLSALTFLCATRRGGVVQRLLSCAPLAVLSRLTFGVYLIHYPFFYVWLTAARERTYQNIFNMVSSSVVVFVWSCLLSLCLFLACEAPLGRLDKLLWGSAAPRQQQKQEAKVPERTNGHDIELGLQRREAISDRNLDVCEPKTSNSQLQCS